MFNRRDFLKAIGSVGIFLLTPLDKLVSRQSSPKSRDNFPSGELVAGFLLLPKDAPLPAFVDLPPCPIFGHVSVEDSSRLDALKGRTADFESIDALQADIDFPIFTPNPVFNMTFLQGCVTKYAGSGDIWEARYNFASDNVQQAQITFLARPVFAHPYPVWPVMDLVKAANVGIGDEEPVIEPEKVDFTPTPGILLPIDDGYTIQWIKQDVLYTVFVENQGQRIFADDFITTLLEN